MGLFTPILDALFGDRESKSSTTVKDDGSNVEVRSSSVFYEKENNSKGEHSTVFSKTTIDNNTGGWKHEEGYHGDKSNK